MWPSGILLLIVVLRSDSTCVRMSSAGGDGKVTGAFDAHSGKTTRTRVRSASGGCLVDGDDLMVEVADAPGEGDEPSIREDSTASLSTTALFLVSPAASRWTPTSRWWSWPARSPRRSGGVTPPARVAMESGALLGVRPRDSRAGLRPIYDPDRWSSSTTEPGSLTAAPLGLGPAVGEASLARRRGTGTTGRLVARRRARDACRHPRRPARCDRAARRSPPRLNARWQSNWQSPRPHGVKFGNPHRNAHRT